jgi:hypothetical protein
MTPDAMAKDTLSITDNRTGKSYEVPIKDGCIKTADLRQIRVDDHDFGLMGYDPAFLNTANCRSAITFIDGDKGILEYRGYPIEQLAEKSSYLEVAYLLLNGELPSRKQLDDFVYTVTHHTYVHENITEYLDGFRYNAHPMSCWRRPCPRSPPSTQRRRTSRTRRTAGSSRSAWSPRCRPSPPSASGTRWGCPTSTRTTT